MQRTERIRSARRRSNAGALRIDIDWQDAQRNAGTYFRKFKRLDLLEAASRRPHQFVFHSDKMSSGLVRFCADVQNMKDVAVLWPVENETSNAVPVKLEDIHQIIRELVTGIYVFNEIPDVKLVGHYDNSGAALCILPLPYEDTRVGQVLIDAIAGVNAHLNGVEFPSERRRRFTQTWRDVMKIGKREKTPPTTTELEKVYVDAGSQEVTDFPFIDINQDGESLDIRLLYGITVTGNGIQQHDNVFVMDPQWNPTSYFMTPDDSLDICDHIESHRSIQTHFDIFRQTMDSTSELRHNLVLLQFIGCMIQLLTAWKSRCKVPDVESFRLPLRADDLKTERELPPLFVTNPKCESSVGVSGHLVQQEGFINFHKSICDCVPVGESMMQQYRSLAVKHDYADSDQFGHSRITLNDRFYAVLCLKLESYYATSPKLPPWIHAMVNEMSNQVAGIPTLSDSRIQDIVRQRIGSRQASKVKSSNALLVLSAQHGFSSVIEVVAKRSAQTRLSNASNDDGLALLHHAAIHDQVCIIQFLAQRGCDLNVRRLHLSEGFVSPSAGQMGETPLHVAARLGCLSSVCCLIVNDANPCLYDVMKWMPIHHSAFHNHSQIVHYLISNNMSLLESRTDDDRKATPLMQATLGGSLDAVKQLVQLGASLGVVDGFGKSLVHAAAMNLHINILLFYAQCDPPSLRIFHLLVDMLKSPLETREPELAARCLDPVTTAHASYWEKLVEAGGVIALAHLLKSSDVTVQACAALVLQNISGNSIVQRAIVDLNAVPDLVSLLKAPNADIQSRCSVILADVGTVDDNCDSIAAQGAIEHLVSLLHSGDRTVQLNSANCIRVLVDENLHNQSTFLSYNGIRPLINLLSLDSDDIQACAAETVKAATTRFEEAQDAFVDNNGIRLLIILLRSRNPRVQVQAARAMEAIADGNVKAQTRIMFGDDGSAGRTHPIGTHALKRLLKFKTPELKIKGASALWSVAGTTVANQRHVASLIGIDMLIQLLNLRNERLAIVASQAIHALSSGPAAFRHRIGESGGVLPLVRLLKPQDNSSRAVLINVARTLVSLCVGPANTPHTENQNTIAAGRGVIYLVELMDKHSDLLVRANAAWVLSCISLGNMPVQQSVVTCIDFDFVSILRMLRSKSDEVCLCAGMALAMFAYNSLTHQKAIRDVGGIHYSLFERFLQSEQETHRGYAAFQTVILAKVLKGPGELKVTIRGLETLISLLYSKSEESQIVSADCLASLAHTRAGISAAITAAGGVKLLLKKLGSPVEAISASAATALGYLTFNRTAAREMMTAMRTDPRLYDVFHRHTIHGKVSPEFVENWQETVKIGLPSLFLESRGGPPVIADRKPLDGRISVPLLGWHPNDGDVPSPFRFRGRSKSISTQGIRSTKPKSKRCISAPANIPRQQSVTSISVTYSSTTVSRKRSELKGPLTDDHVSMLWSRQQAVTFDDINS